MSLLEALNEAGVATNTARGFWGGVASDGSIVVTAWRDIRSPDGGYPVWKPRDNKAGLKAAWDEGRIVVGTKVKVIILKAKQELPIGEQRSVATGKFMSGEWEIVRLVEGEDWDAVVDRVS